MRRGNGTFGATQATVLALKALTEVALAHRQAAAGGVVYLVVNGVKAGSKSFEATDRDPLVFTGLARLLTAGDNTFALTTDAERPLPYTVDLRWRQKTPTSSGKASLALSTTIAAEEVGMGETVRLSAVVTNTGAKGVPSPIARIGLPAGLESQTWQLEELRDRKKIAFFETGPREVILYWDGLEPGASTQVDLDLTAVLPGDYEAPPSSAYPYYDDDFKSWVAGHSVRIR